MFTTLAVCTPGYMLLYRNVARMLQYVQWPQLDTYSTAGALKASFVRAQCNSSQLSISLSQVTVSRERKNAAPAQSGTTTEAATRFPTHPTDRARADSWLLCYDSGETGLYFVSRCLDWHLTVVREHSSSGVTQELWLC